MSLNPFVELEVYERNENSTLVKTGIILDTIDLVEHREINGLWSLDFSIPSSSNNAMYLTSSNDKTKFLFKIDGRYYYPIEVLSDTDAQIIRATCRHVITLLDKYIFINIFPIKVNTNCKEIMEMTLDLREENPDFPDFEFSLFTAEELTERGMQWVSQAFDVLNGFDYVTGYDMIGNCLKLAGRGELYFENFKFAIVERIGDGEVKDSWNKEDKLSTFTLTRNYDELMNVILVEGKDGMPLDLETYPNSVIVDSQSVREYGVRRGRLYFSDVDNKDELARRALWEIDSLNPDRVSKHKETLNIAVTGVDVDLNVGDSIRVIDYYIDDTIPQYIIKRITSMEINWNDRGQDVYVLGDAALTELQLLAKLEATRQTVNNITTANGDVDTSLINLIVSAIDGRNRCKNSKFSLFDRMGLPKYWDTTNAAVTDLDSRFGTFSLEIVERGRAYSPVLNVHDWEDESTMTLIEIWHKGAFELMVEATDNDGNRYEEEPVIILHQSKYEAEKKGSTPFNSLFWTSTPAYVIVYNQDIPENGNFRVLIQSVNNEPLYIGGMFVGPGNLSQIKLYSDGPHSDRFDEEGADMISFTRKKNDEDAVEIATETEEYISDIQLSGSNFTQLDMQVCIIAETEDEYIDCEVRIYDNNDLLYTYPYKTFGEGKNTISLARVMDKLEAGEHIFELRVYNNGTNDLVIDTNDGVFSMIGKFVNMEEVPPIPVINEYDYIRFAPINATAEIAAIVSAAGFFAAEDEVLFTFDE